MLMGVRDKMLLFEYEVSPLYMMRCHVLMGVRDRMLLFEYEMSPWGHVFEYLVPTWSGETLGHLDIWGLTERNRATGRA